MNTFRFRHLIAALAVLSGALLLPVTGAGAQGGPPPPDSGGGGVVAPGYLHPLTPARVLDTRTGTGAPAAKVGPGQEIALQVTGRGGVPTDAGAVVLNVTVTEPSTAGYLTVYPSGAARPTASNLNFTPGQTVPNLVVAKVGADGKVRIFNSSGTTHVIADVMGWYDDIFSSFPSLPAGGSRQQGIAPTRLLDTRTNTGPIGPGGERELQVAGLGAIPANATAVVLNVTVTAPTAAGYLTVHPSGTPRPTASNLNFTPAQTVPNLVIAKVGAGGKVKLFNSAGATHVIVDATAYYAPVTQALAGGELNALTPNRILDTRTGHGAPAAKIGPGQDITLKVTGTNGVPELNVDSVVLNVTVTEPTASGYLTVHPSNTPRPTASNLNFTPGQTVPNLVVAKVGADGTIRIFNSSGTTHVIADIIAWHNGDAPAGGGGPVPEGSTPEAPSGGSPAGGPPVGGGTAAATAVAVSTSDEVPSEEEAAAAPTLLEDGSLIAGDPLPENTQAAFNEPLYAGSWGYAADTPPAATGRVFGWDLVNGGWQRSGPCSGTVVGPDIVLTAAHCLTGTAANGPYEAFSFVPQLRGNSAPKGEWLAAGDRAWVDQLYHDGTRANAAWSMAFDYGFIKLDPVSNGGKRVHDYTGSFPIRMEAARSTASKYAVGYPVEGMYDSQVGGYCSRWSWECYPTFCNSWNGDSYHFGNGWYALGFGCQLNGGMSGAGTFAPINGKWYVVSLVTNGGYIYGSNNQQCAVRFGCSWYMRNAWGPEFRQGYLDALWRYAVNA